MSEAIPNPKIDSVEQVTTTRRVLAAFDAEDAAIDLTMGELRAAIAAADHLPDEATVTVHAGGHWRTPGRLLMDCTTHRAAEHDDIVRSDQEVRNR